MNGHVIGDIHRTGRQLQHIGEDVAGAAQFVRTDRLEFVLSRPSHLAPLEAKAIAEMLRRAKASLPISASDTDGKFSLAGAQAKIALHQTSQGWSDPADSIPSTHIVKPAIPGMDDQDLVEAVTLRTAAGLGLRVSHCAVEDFADERGLVVTRFDRTKRSQVWRRVHQEDMCQALGLWPTRKYESQGGPGAATIVDLLRRTSREPGEDIRRFAQALVYNSHLAYSDGRGTICPCR